MKVQLTLDQYLITPVWQYQGGLPRGRGGRSPKETRKGKENSFEMFQIRENTAKPFEIPETTRLSAWS